MSRPYLLLLKLQAVPDGLTDLTMRLGTIGSSFILENQLVRSGVAEWETSVECSGCIGHYHGTPAMGAGIYCVSIRQFKLMKVVMI